MAVRVDVRPERSGEEASVHAVNVAAFGGPLEADIVDAIRHTDRWIEGGSLVAERDGRLVGHLLLSEGDLARDDGHVRRIWMLGPVGVVPDQQGRGIGTALMRTAIEFAILARQPVLCLLGHADYYPRFGFEPARPLGIHPPKPWNDRNWLALRLPAWDPSLGGVAHFPLAFPE